MLEQSRHLVFTGNPGTGKTTVARLLAQIYRTLGVVEKGHLVETDRSGLVAGFVGQTATKVVEVFDAADQGALLIDEAYSLIRGGDNDFGREAIDTIVKLVEDRRDRLVVIVAGYPDEMAELVDANPGLQSRFPKTIHFPDYTTDELVAIFEMTAGKGPLRAHRRGQGQGRGRGSTPSPATRASATAASRATSSRHAVGRQATRLAVGRRAHRRAAPHPRGRRLPGARRDALRSAGEDELRGGSVYRSACVLPVDDPGGHQLRVQPAGGHQGDDLGQQRGGVGPADVELDAERVEPPQRHRHLGWPRSTTRCGGCPRARWRGSPTGGPRPDAAVDDDRPRRRHARRSRCAAAWRRSRSARARTSSSALATVTEPAPSASADLGRVQADARDAVAGDEHVGARAAGEVRRDGPVAVEDVVGHARHRDRVERRRAAG